MLNLNENTRMGSALATAFNHRETFLNGGTAATGGGSPPVPPGFEVLGCVCLCQSRVLSPSIKATSLRPPYFKLA